MAEDSGDWRADPVFADGWWYFWLSLLTGGGIVGKKVKSVKSMESAESVPVMTVTCTFKGPSVVVHQPLPH